MNLKDSTGWPIVIDARVRVDYGVYGDKHIYRNGIVEKLGETFVEVRLFKNLNLITVKPEQCKVMKGKTKSSYEYELLRERLRRKKK